MGAGLGPLNAQQEHLQCSLFYAEKGQANSAPCFIQQSHSMGFIQEPSTTKRRLTKITQFAKKLQINF